MRMTHVVLGLAAAAALAIACTSSSGPMTYVVSGTCDPLNATLKGTAIALSGPCNLGAAGDYTLDAGLSVNLATCDGGTYVVINPVAIQAQFIQSSNGTLNASFVGTASISCPLGPETIPVAGTFTFAGGTGSYTDATGTATVVDGGVVVTDTGFSASLGLTGSLTY